MSQLKKLGQKAADALASKGAKVTGKAVDRLQHVEADPQAFFKAVESVRASDNPMFRANITQYSPEDYAKFKTYLSPDGKSGYAIKPDGELISVFSTEKGRGELILDDAVERGAQKLDAFDINGKLPKLYSKYFDETERFKFDPKQAPADWNKAALGEPDIVMMKLNPNKVKAQGTLKEVRALRPGEWTKLPLEKRNEYLSALDQVVGNKQSRQAGTIDTFHGTSYEQPIEKFKADKAKSGQLYGKGTYSTTSPEQAELYTQILDDHSGIPLEEASGSIYPLKVKTNSIFDVDNVDPKKLELIKKDLNIKGNIEPRYLGTREGVTPEKFTKVLKKHGYDTVKDGDVINSLESKNIRSKNAAFDPYFKDSDNIMAAREPKPGAFSKALELLGKPQQYASDKLVEAAGIEKGESSEQNFANVADKVVDKYLVPPGSGSIADEYVGPALKAGAVAAAEVFGDPLNVIPIGKVAKIAGKAIKNLPEMKALGTIADTATKLKAEIAASGAKKMTRAQELARLAEMVKKPAKAEGSTLNYKQLKEEFKNINTPKDGGTLDYKQIVQDYKNKNK